MAGDTPIDHTTAGTGAATGGVRLLLRLEGLALLAASIIAYAVREGSWLMFAGLFLAPDISFLGYLVTPRFGALVYNAAHSTLAPAALLLAGWLGASPPAMAIALIWLSHIGFDRAVGYGLKYAAGFGHTHLGRIGRHTDR